MSGAASTPAEDGSLQGVGSEASPAERDEILAVEHGYLLALAKGDYGGACARLSATARRSLGLLVVPSLRSKGCDAILPALLSPQAAATSRQAAEGKVTRVRIKGSQAFVLYHAPGAKLFVMTMGREGGEWKATGLGGSVLVPDLG